LKIDQFLAQQILTATNKTNATLDYFGEKKAITINIPTTTTYYSASYGYINTIQQSDYEHLSLSIGTTSTLINVKDLLDAKGDFNENKWNTKL
jgi:hypothetical protein